MIATCQWCVHGRQHAPQSRLGISEGREDGGHTSEGLQTLSGPQMSSPLTLQLETRKDAWGSGFRVSPDFKRFGNILYVNLDREPAPTGGNIRNNVPLGPQ